MRRAALPENYLRLLRQAGKSPRLGKIRASLARAIESANRQKLAEKIAVVKKRLRGIEEQLQKRPSRKVSGELVSAKEDLYFELITLQRKNKKRGS